MTAESDEQRRREALQLQVRESLGRGYTLVHSRSYTDLALSMGVDDFKQLEIERIEGPPEDGTSLRGRSRRKLSAKQRVEEIRGQVLYALDTIRANIDLVTDSE